MRPLDFIYLGDVGAGKHAVLEMREVELLELVECVQFSQGG